MLRKGKITEVGKIFNRPALGQIISGPKCDRDKLIISEGRWGQ